MLASEVCVEESADIMADRMMRQGGQEGEIALSQDITPKDMAPSDLLPLSATA